MYMSDSAVREIHDEENDIFDTILTQLKKWPEEKDRDPFGR